MFYCAILLFSCSLAPLCLCCLDSSQRTPNSSPRHTSTASDLIFNSVIHSDFILSMEWDESSGISSMWILPGILCSPFKWVATFSFLFFFFSSVAVDSLMGLEASQNYFPLWLAGWFLSTRVYLLVCCLVGMGERLIFCALYDLRDSFCSKGLGDLHCYTKQWFCLSSNNIIIQSLIKHCLLLTNI